MHYATYAYIFHQVELADGVVEAVGGVLGLFKE